MKLVGWAIATQSPKGPSMGKQQLQGSPTPCSPREAPTSATSRRQGAQGAGYLPATKVGHLPPPSPSTHRGPLAGYLRIWERLQTCIDSHYALTHSHHTIITA